MQIYRGEIGPILCGKYVESVNVRKNNVEKEIRTIEKSKQQVFIAICSNNYKKVLEWIKSLGCNVNIAVFRASGLSELRYAIVVSNFSPGAGTYSDVDAGTY